MNNKNNVLYSVQKCKKNDALYGPVHGSDDGETSVCGLQLNENWFIIDNTFTGTITCKKCLDIIKKRGKE